MTEGQLACFVCGNRYWPFGSNTSDLCNPCALEIAKDDRLLRWYRQQRANKENKRRLAAAHIPDPED